MPMLTGVIARKSAAVSRFAKFGKHAFQYIGSPTENQTVASVQLKKTALQGRFGAKNFFGSSEKVIEVLKVANKDVLLLFQRVLLRKTVFSSIENGEAQCAAALGFRRCFYNHSS